MFQICKLLKSLSWAVELRDDSLKRERAGQYHVPAAAVKVCVALEGYELDSAAPWLTGGIETPSVAWRGLVANAVHWTPNEICE